ncbi:MAG TPA: hypothetical protein VGK79_00555, partial [Gaiellaceae bacterium]
PPPAPPRPEARAASGGAGGGVPWPQVTHLDLQSRAAGFGCPAQRVADHASLVQALDDVVPTLAARNEPLLLEVVVEQDPEFAP